MDVKTYGVKSTHFLNRYSLAKRNGDQIGKTNDHSSLNLAPSLLLRTASFEIMNGQN